MTMTIIRSIIGKIIHILNYIDDNLLQWGVSSDWGIRKASEGAPQLVPSSPVGSLGDRQDGSEPPHPL